MRPRRTELRGLENDDQGADRERQDMAKKNPALFIPVKMG
jgi:hypothetical protein